MDFTLKFLDIFFKGLYLAGPLLLFFVCVIVVLGQIVGKIEKWRKFDAFYWSFVTATTVGYGDLRPEGKGAKCLSIIIAFTGLIFTGIIIAIALESVSLTFSMSSEFDSVRERIQQFQ